VHPKPHVRTRAGFASILKALLPWSVLLVVIATAFIIALSSPLLEWRDPIYIIAGFAGVVAMALFSIWGVIALWAVFAAALLAAFRQRLRLRPSYWRFAHIVMAIVVVLGSVVHAMLIEGTMGTISKAFLCASLLAATLWVVVDLRLKSMK